MPVRADRVIGVRGARVNQFTERLRGIEALTEVYWSDHDDGVDAVLASYSFIVKAICNAEKRECRITLYDCESPGNAVAFEYSLGDMTRAIFTAAALAHGTAWFVADLVKEKTCPHCRARYVYPQEKFIDGVNVECQNCARVFETRQTTVEVPPKRVLGEPTECPYCRALYVYTENDLDEERTTGCHNCGVRIAFPSILDEWEEYQQLEEGM